MNLADPFRVPTTESPPPVELPVKDCPQSMAYEPHPEHSWEKRGRNYQCEGIPEVEDQPECLIYVSPEHPKCGNRAPAKIRVKTKLTDARVPVCLVHKAEYDNQAATFRAKRHEAQPQQRAS